MWQWDAVSGAPTRSIAALAPGDLDSSLPMLSCDASRGLYPARQYSVTSNDVEFAAHIPLAPSHLISRDQSKIWALPPGRLALTVHGQRRDAFAAVCPGMGSNSIAELPPRLTADHLAHEFEGPSLPRAAVVVQIDNELVVTLPGLAPFPVMEHSEHLLSVVCVESDAGSGAILIICNPFVCILQGRRIIGPRIVNHDINSGRIFFNARHQALVVFLCTQEGSIFCAVYAMGVQQWFCSEIYSVEFSVNDVAVLAFLGSDFLVVGVTDSTAILILRVRIRYPLQSAPPSRDSIQVRAVKRLDALRTGLLSCEVGSQDNVDTTWKKKYFIYCSFTESCRYFAASNDMGRYVAVWRVVESVDETGGSIPTLELLWKHVMPFAPLGARVMRCGLPYKIVPVGWSSFGVQVGDLIGVLDPTLLRWDVVRPVRQPRHRRLWSNDTDGELLALSSYGFGGRYLLSGNLHSMVLVELREAALWVKPDVTLLEKCLALVRRHSARFSSHHELVPLQRKGLELIQFCPFGHFLDVYFPSVDCTRLRGFGGRPVQEEEEREALDALRLCHRCRLDAGIKLFCHTCSYSLCDVCAHSVLDQGR